MNQTTEHNFTDSIVVGADGERLILEFIKSLPSVKTAEDVSKILAYQKIDVDFVVTTADGDNLQYELKTEPTAANTRNFFFEFISNEAANTPGCFTYSEAHYWMSFIPQTGDLYIFPLEKCREYVYKAVKSLSIKRVLNKARDGRSVYWTLGYAIRITDVCNNVPYNHRNIRDFVDYEYIVGDSKRNISPAFKNIAWKQP